MYRPDLLFHQQYPTRYGSKVTRCLMPSDKTPTVIQTGIRTARERCICQHQAEMGSDAWYGTHVNSWKRRKNEQAKGADRLEPKRQCGGYRVSSVPCHGQQTPPAYREHLTHSCQPCGTW